MNLRAAEFLLKELVEQGLSAIVICPGSFNSPFVVAAQHMFTENLYFHFEERGAAFFALGLAKRSQQAVAVCVTSGTAVAECLPAVVEASYSGIPLLVLSADREEALSGTGYPQAIIQQDLLSSHCAWRYDVDSQEVRNKQIRLPRNAPCHLNLRFSEPILLGTETAVLIEPPKQARKQIEQKGRRFSLEATKTLNDFLLRTQAPLCILEDIPTEERHQVANFLKTLAAPFILEGRSGLHEIVNSFPNQLHSYDSLCRPEHFDAVLRIGAVPTTNAWRNFERDPKWHKKPVFSLVYSGGSGLSRGLETLYADEIDFESFSLTRRHPRSAELFALDRALSEKKKELMGQFPGCELSLLGNYLEASSTPIYLGNSLAIRHYNELSSLSAKMRETQANRGANGIDGQIASFLGWAGQSEAACCVLGDLTFLYDVNSLTLLDQFTQKIRHIVVINNKGGRIFEKLPYFDTHFGQKIEGKRFLNEHTRSVSKIAEGFGIPGLVVASPMSSKEIADLFSGGPMVIELAVSHNDEPSYGKALENWLSEALLSIGPLVA